MTDEIKPKKRRSSLSKKLFTTDIAYGVFHDAINKEAMKKAIMRHLKALGALGSEGEQSFSDKEKQQELIDAERELTEIKGKLKRSKTNAKNASEPPKKKPNPTKEEVITYRDNFYKKFDKYHGWKKAACIDLKTTNKTLNTILNKLNEGEATATPVMHF